MERGDPPPGGCCCGALAWHWTAPPRSGRSVSAPAAVRGTQSAPRPTESGLYPIFPVPGVPQPPPLPTTELEPQLAGWPADGLPTPDRSELSTGRHDLSPSVVPIAAGIFLERQGQDLEEKRWRCCPRTHEFFQQSEPGLRVPLYLYDVSSMRLVSGGCSVIFVVIGIIMLTAASAAFEQRIDYDASTLSKAFHVDVDLAGPVLLSYQIPDVLMNHRSFVMSKDPALMSSALVPLTCDGATTEAEVASRRPGDDHFLDLVRNSTAFRPCGFVPLAMFTDEFALYDQTRGVAVSLDQSSLALSADDDLYDGRLLRVSNPGPYGPFFTVEGEPSWVQDGAFLEHFKVWQRSSASPSVRNLWARIEGGLAKGSYELRFIRNSPVWTESWGVPHKSVLVTVTNVFGNASACVFVGAISLVISFLHAISLLFFLLAPLPRWQC